MIPSAAGFVLAIDNGSQSTKVLIVDEQGHVHASARVPLRPYASPAPGRWEHPDDDLWDSILTAIRAALGQFPGDPKEIRGIGLCTIRFCRAVLRADGTLAQPMISWMDERLSRRYEREVDDASYVTSSSGYIAHRLTGLRRDAAGNYQGMWPIDTSRWTWSDNVDDYARTGMDPSELFELVAPGGELGPLSAEVAKVVGLRAGIPVIATSNDKAVEALGAGLQGEGTALLSLGTYVATMTPGTQPLGARSHLWTSFASEPGRYLYESIGVRRGMWTVSWFRDLVSSGDQAISETTLNQEAALVPAGAGGLIVSPDWLAPTDESWRRGAIVGFDGTQGRAHIHRAILEALAIETERLDADARRELGRGREALIVTGGGSKSELMLGILAAVYDVNVRTPVIRDAAGLGAAICATIGVGMHGTWAKAIGAMTAFEECVIPDPALTKAYAAIKADYARVLPRVRDLYRKPDVECE